LEQILANSKAQPLLIVNTEGEIKQSSDGFSQIFFPVQTGEAVSSYIHPEDRAEFKTWFNNLNTQQFRAGQVKNLRLIDQKGMILSVMVRPEQTPDQTYILWFWEDKRVRETEDYWQSALTPAMEAVLTSILDGVFLVNVEGKLVEVNPALCQMLGYHKFELIGMSVGMLFSRDEKESQKATSRFARIIKFNRVKEMNITLEDRSGNKLDVTYNGAIIREGSQLVGILGIVRDNRDSKIMRDLHQKTEDLENAMVQLAARDKMKDDFLSLVGHELRTPLANILGYAEFLDEGNVKEGERKEFIGVIYQESRRLARLVNEILDLSRLEAGRLIYHHVLQPLDPVLLEAVDAVRAEAEQKRVRISKNLGAGPELWIDRDRIKQVAINLLINAVKYSNSETETKISSKELDGGIMVAVEDQGMGIALENLEKVFEKFSRVESLEHHTQGAGLGLPIAKKIIEEGHSGRMWLESQGLGKGSTFFFWIPKQVKNAG